MNIKKLKIGDIFCCKCYKLYGIVMKIGQGYIEFYCLKRGTWPEDLNIYITNTDTDFKKL